MTNLERMKLIADKITFYKWKAEHYRTLYGMYRRNEDYQTATIAHKAMIYAKQEFRKLQKIDQNKTAY